MDYDSRPETTSGNGGCGTGANQAMPGPVDGPMLRMHLGQENQARPKGSQTLQGHGQPASVPLRERVYAAMQCSQRELEYNQRRFQHAHRCAQLMELHPEVAELVELLREF